MIEREMFESYCSLVSAYFKTRLEMCGTVAEVDEINRQVQRWGRQINAWLFKSGDFPEFP